MKDECLDGFTINLYFDGEHWLAHFVEMPEISAYALSPENALKELQCAWDMVKADYVESGETVPVAPQRSKQKRVASKLATL